MVVHIDLFIFLCICSCRFVSRPLIFSFLCSFVLFSCIYQSLINMILVEVRSYSIEKLSIVFSIILHRVKFFASLLYEMEVQPALLLECLNNNNYANLLEVLWINGLWKQTWDGAGRGGGGVTFWLPRPSLKGRLKFSPISGENFSKIQWIWEKIYLKFSKTERKFLWNPMNLRENWSKILPHREKIPLKSNELQRKFV